MAHGPSKGTDPASEMEVRDDDAAREKVLEIARKARIAMMATYDAEGNAHARPMAQVDQEAASEGGDLWFMTDDGSRKIDEIEADPRVLLTYGDEKRNDWLSVEGRAEVVRKRAVIERLWSEPMRTFFPDGPDGGGIAAIRVRPEAAEYWDSPSGVVLFAYGYLKARLTGEPPEAGEVARVDMRP